MSSSTPEWLYINEPIVNMRESPTTRVKVVSQAILSEQIAIKKQSQDWSYITTPDGYSGWIPSTTIIARKTPYPGPTAASARVSRLSAPIYEEKDIEYGPVKTLAFQTNIEIIDSSDPRWITTIFPDGKVYYIQKGDVSPQEIPQTKTDLVSLSQTFIGLPYIWGGRSSFGYDCSGFVQMLYRQLGIILPRDSHQQIQDSRFFEIPINEASPGDLIFFGKSAQQIMHVGMSLGNKQFIHATSRENKPWVRINSINDPEWSGHPSVYYPYRIIKQIEELSHADIR